jgi:hypothetical protein
VALQPGTAWTLLPPPGTGSWQFRYWCAGLLRSVAFWLYTKVSEEHTASIFGIEVKRVRKVMGYYSVNSKVRPGGWAKGGQRVYIIESN